MMKIVIILFTLIIPIGSSLFAQSFDKERIRTYLIGIGEMQDGDDCSYYAYELIKSDSIKETDSCGIYRIGVYASHTYTYLLLLDKQKVQFIDCHTDLYKTLSSVFSFFESCNCCFTDTEMFNYTKEVVNIFHRNETTVPW